MGSSEEASLWGVCRTRLEVAEEPAACGESGRPEMDRRSGGDLTGGKCHGKYPTRVL